MAKPFFGQGPAPYIARMNMEAATDAGRAYGNAFANLGKVAGDAFKAYGENKKKGEAADMQIGAILEGMSDERKAEITSGDNPLGKSLEKFIQGELPHSKKEALLGSLVTLDARDRMDRQEEMVSKFNQLRVDQLEQANEQQKFQQQGQNQFSSLMAKGMAKESNPTQFMEMVGQARDDGLLNDYATNLATNHFFKLQSAENEALKQRNEFENKVKFEVFKENLKNQPQEEPYQAGPDIMANSIGRSMEIIQTNPKFTTGLGSYLKSIPGTEAKTLDNLFKTIKSNIGFDYLQAMRKNSPTGGALGNVSNQELEGLQSVFGSLEQSQSDKELKYNLQLLNHVYSNVVHGVDKHNVPHPDQSSPSNQGPQSMQNLLDEEARLQELLYQREGIFDTPEAQVIDATGAR
jgi:hypothetical protein